MIDPDLQYCSPVDFEMNEHPISSCQPSRISQYGMYPKNKIRLILECSREEKSPALRTASQLLSKPWLDLGWEVCLAEMKGYSNSLSDIPRKFLADNLSYMTIRLSKPEEASREFSDSSGNRGLIGDNVFQGTLRLIGVSINYQIMRVLKNLNLSSLYLRECSFIENGHFEDFLTLKRLYMHLRQDVTSEFTLPPYLEELVIYFSKSYSSNLRFFFNASKCESLVHM
jgi:hypothetical protein